ncbi:Asp-tRNA(Asn)/Glu-tRNA(Gln) amidotransferase subunit GatC [Patescibacteria group bacterium]|nr:Asp-tRNA(Asn)/Glu-tRNA(Gln) amidotransferase subunit GatC [Patescibacteria group bacterium]
MDINHIAKLARLGLSEKEKEKLEKELPSILKFVDKLNEVKADKIDPTTQVTGLENVVRKDKARVKSKQETEKLLKLVPNIKDRHVKVKAIL